jgi:phage terminase large subunit-like protein
MPWPIPHQPTDKQRAFLLHGGQEAFFGGAGGGGKSDALLMAALQWVDLPGYSAIIFRRTYADLALPGALMDRSKDWLHATGAVWNEQRKIWAFPSGAKLAFGYLENAGDERRYKSAEFHYIAFDELTEFPEKPYRFLFSRLRRLEGSPVPLRMRSASNPGGSGHSWVKRRFVDRATRGDRIFFPATMDDNPHLDRAGYRRSLREVDPVERERIEKGNWEIVEEGRFRSAWLRYYTRQGTSYLLGGRYLDQSQINSCFLTVDPAATIKETAGHDPDYTAVSAWGYGDGQLLWLGCVLTRCEVPEIPPLVAREYRLHRCTNVYFRSPGMEKAVVQLCQRHRDPTMNVINWDAKGDKLQKAADFLNMAEAGRVWLPAPGAAQPHSGPFPMEEVEANLLQFTGADSGHDDIWDTAGTAGAVAEAKVIGPPAAPWVIRP